MATACAGERTDRQIIEQLVAEADAGRPTSELIEAAKERGIASALVAGEFLDEQKPARAQALYEVISLTANCRRLSPEILRLYQPAAWELFRGPYWSVASSGGLPAQRRLAKGLAWATWPEALPDAMVRAAPQPTLVWLVDQANSPTPDFDKVRRTLRSMGSWLRSYSERSHLPDFQDALCALCDNRLLTEDEPTCVALLRALGDAKTEFGLDRVASQLRSKHAGVRAAAAEATGQMISALSPMDKLGPMLDEAQTAALRSFLSLAREETDPGVLAKLATAAEAWAEAPNVGQAMLELYDRVDDAAMQRNLLFAVGKTRWPQRGAIIQRGLVSRGNGVIGVALEAVVAHPLPELAPAVLALLETQKEPQPNLIDAAGALGDPRALPTLQRWLVREKNLALQLKLASALENIPGETSAAALCDLLEHSVEPVLAEQLCRAASHRELTGAVPILCGLAEDMTAPLAIRGQAVWALGRYPDPTARVCLERLGRAPEKYFPATSLTLLPEAVEQARLFIVLARWRQGDAAMEPEVTRLFAAGSPAVKLACLSGLAEIRRDHPVIESALGAPDYAVLLGGVRAAGAAAPTKYLPRLRALSASHLIASLSASGLDTSRLPAALDNAINAAATEVSKP